MFKKTAITTAAVISMGMIALSAGSASAKSWGHSYSGHSCYTKKISYPVYKTVWRTKKVAVPYGCGWEKVKYAKTIKVWRTKWKKVCH
jgi:hypothetical protein